jgi:HlyD family secretion protein
MNSRIVVLASVAVLLSSGGAAYWLLAARTNGDPNKILVSGNIEVIDAQVSFKIPGRVEKRFVDEGQMVKQGDKIAELDTTDLRCDVDLRRAELHAAQAALAELLAGSRPEEIAAAKATMDKMARALADLEAGSRPQEIAAAEATALSTAADEHQAELDLGRSKQLFQRKAISNEEYDRSQTAYQVAVQKHLQAEAQRKLVQEGYRKQVIEQARAALAQAKAQYDLVVAGPRKETIDQARAKVEQVAANLKLAETRLGYATVVSPLSGVVLSKNIEPGEFVVAGTPIVTVGDLVNVWLRAYIEEPDLDRVKVGQRAIVTTDAGKTFEGHVGFISSEAEFTPKNVQTQKERVKLVYRIKIDITNPNMELKPGMPADAEIQLGE